ncbi:MAG: hypothetical protein M1838_004219 [Thelocarpon superellum]|nr:MAG: hypothetical protein M1838_004219 [Thelocarpon superellum]
MLSGRHGLVLASLAVSACAGPDLQTVLAGNSNLTQFNALLGSFGDITAPFSSLQHLSILAPSNDAFNKIAYSDLGPAFAANDTDTIRAVLEYHILNGTLESTTIQTTPLFLPTYLTNDSYVNFTGGAPVQAVRQAGDVIVFVSGLGSRSTLTQPDIAFDGGTIQVIDTFLVPPQDFMNTTRQFNLTAMGGAASKAGLNDTLDTEENVTIFAPNNDAFARVGSGLENMTVEELTKVLGYHVINGTVNFSTMLNNNTVLVSSTGLNLTIYSGSNSQYVNNAQLLQKDIILSNGVMHIIDNVLDYNATDVTPNPAIPTQPPIIPGTSVADTPFTSDFPTTVSSSPSNSATSSSGSNAAATAAATSGAAATSATGATKTSKGGAAPTLASDSGMVAALFGGAAFMAAML